MCHDSSFFAHSITFAEHCLPETLWVIATLESSEFRVKPALLFLHILVWYPSSSSALPVPVEQLRTWMFSFPWLGFQAGSTQQQRSHFSKVLQTPLNNHDKAQFSLNWCKGKFLSWNPNFASFIYNIHALSLPAWHFSSPVDVFIAFSQGNIAEELDWGIESQTLQGHLEASFINKPC